MNAKVKGAKSGLKALGIIGAGAGLAGAGSLAGYAKGREDTKKKFVAYNNVENRAIAQHFARLGYQKALNSNQTNNPGKGNGMDKQAHLENVYLASVGEEIVKMAGMNPESYSEDGLVSIGLDAIEKTAGKASAAKKLGVISKLKSSFGDLGNTPRDLGAYLKVRKGGYPQVTQMAKNSLKASAKGALPAAGVVGGGLGAAGVTGAVVGGRKKQ